MWPSRRGPWVREYARHCRTPSTSIADPDVLPGHVAGPVGARADHQGGGVAGLGDHLDDLAAQRRTPAQRAEEIEVVVGQQRRGRRLGEPDQIVTEAAAQRACSAGRAIVSVMTLV